MTRSAFPDHEVEATANSSTATVEPPDDPLWSPWRSGIVVGAAAPYVFFQKVLQTFPSVMREWLVVDRSLNEAGFGGLSSSFYNPYIPLQIPAGILVTRFGPRAALITGALLCAVASFPFSLSETADFAEATRIPMGLNAAPTVVCALTLATQRLPARLFPRRATLTEVAGMTGTALGRETLGFVVERASWRTAMIGCGVFSAVLLILIVSRAPADSDGMSLSAASLTASFSFWGCLPGVIDSAWLWAWFGRPVLLLSLGALGTAVAITLMLFVLRDPVARGAAMFALGALQCVRRPDLHDGAGPCPGGTVRGHDGADDYADHGRRRDDSSAADQQCWHTCGDSRCRTPRCCARSSSRHWSGWCCRRASVSAMRAGAGHRADRRELTGVAGPRLPAPGISAGGDPGHGCGSRRARPRVRHRLATVVMISTTAMTLMDVWVEISGTST